MATRHALPEPSVDERLEAVLGGDHDKHARKRRKREAKQQRDAERPPGSFERFRILSELVDEGRQVIELTDHRARYALVVMSVLNAFVFLVISRSHLLGELPPTSRTWLISFIGGYGGLTFLFVYYAVDCLRPRRLQYTELLRKGNEGSSGPLGILYWEGIAGSQLVELTCDQLMREPHPLSEPSRPPPSRGLHARARDPPRCARLPT